MNEMQGRRPMTDRQKLDGIRTLVDAMEQEAAMSRPSVQATLSAVVKALRAVLDDEGLKP